MGFSTNVSLISSTGAGANTLNGRTGLQSLSTISATSGPEGINYPQIKIDPTTCEQLTAYITGIYVAQTLYNGSATYIAKKAPMFNYNNLSSLPFKIYYNNNATGSNSTGFSLSATGLECSSGQQTFTMYFQLSSTALSGTSAGNVIPVAITNPAASFDGVTTAPTVSVNTNIWTVNTPFPSDLQCYFCNYDFYRAQQFLG